MITREQATAWLDGYKRAWETRSPELIAALFSDAAEYHITPFQAPLIGREAIREYWRGIARTQHDIMFNYAIVPYTDDLIICHWNAAFTRTNTGKRIQLDGVMFIELDSTGCCRRLREWWHRKEIDV